MHRLKTIYDLFKKDEDFQYMLDEFNYYSDIFNEAFQTLEG